MLDVMQEVAANLFGGIVGQTCWPEPSYQPFPPASRLTRLSDEHAAILELPEITISGLHNILAGYGKLIRELEASELIASTRTDYGVPNFTRTHFRVTKGGRSALRAHRRAALESIGVYEIDA